MNGLTQNAHGRQDEDHTEDGAGSVVEERKEPSSLSSTEYRQEANLVKTNEMTS